MATILVHVMPKPEILDPQGKAVGAALPRLGFDGISQVRQGKRFELTVDGEVTDEVLANVRKAAETLLSNPVIEDVVQVKVVREGGCGCGGHGHGAGKAEKDLLA
ncbi:phosphoribosylformylglycinamidine synthase subunit PurS [Demequina mangrovi]|uniref:Phosphoribosylformylglycinamidine synthase subunit PurS n=1 Tax=Demequina mangrovi TaxID=1043493 RepID=A0A1H7AC76_9MICO|nr:phosphoribosylformylglycinamidine synthase subunit PurS [Demequina mangrovi]SEJ61497.1 phosphoribosylformylglycinamidine synthase [Demequina mangrovi]